MKRTSIAGAGIVVLLGQAVLMLDNPGQARISRTRTTTTSCGVEGL